jgi:hypothetical protein
VGSASFALPLGAIASNFRCNPMRTLSLPEKPAQSLPIADLSH